MTALILKNTDVDDCEISHALWMDAKQGLEKTGFWLMLDLVFVKPARVALLLAFNGDLPSRFPPAVHTVLVRTTRQLKVEFALVVYFCFFVWFGFRTLWVDWFLASTLAVVEPEVITVQCALSKSKALIRESRCSATTHVIAWLAVRLILVLNLTTFHQDGDFFRLTNVAGSCAMHFCYDIFCFSLWQKLARSA